MIRVLHFSHAINPNDYMDSVLGRLDRRRFEVSALVVRPARDGRTSTGLPYDTRCLNVVFSRRTYPAMYRGLVAAIRAIRPHIVHAHHYDESIIAAVAVRTTRVPGYVIGRHYADLLYRLSQGLKLRVFLAAEAFANRTAARVVVPSRHVQQVLVDRQGVPAEKVCVIPYGLDMSAYQSVGSERADKLRAQLGIGDRYLLLSCGRLNREKGLDSLLAAVRELKKRRNAFHLVVVGDGPERPMLERLVREWQLTDVVTFVGWRNDALDWIAAADLIVHPSLSEAYSQVLVEALALFKPLVATPVGSAPEIIGNNERGRLVPIGDSAALTDAITELFDNRALGRALAEAGRAYIERTANPEQVARRQEKVYEAVLETRGQPVSSIRS